MIATDPNAPMNDQTHITYFDGATGAVVRYPNHLVNHSGWGAKRWWCAVAGGLRLLVSFLQWYNIRTELLVSEKTHSGAG